jgi:hypothetical protein
MFLSLSVTVSIHVFFHIGKSLQVGEELVPKVSIRCTVRDNASPQGTENSIHKATEREEVRFILESLFIKRPHLIVNSFGFIIIGLSWYGFI